MKATALTAVIVVGFLGFWYYWWNVAQPTLPSAKNGVSIKVQRSLIDPSAFTREDTLQSLYGIEASSPLLGETSRLAFSPAPGEPIPAEVQPFIIPAQGEKIVVEKAEESGIVRISYATDLAVPESYPRFVRLANPKKYTLMKGFRNSLAAMIDLESAGYYIRISQLVVSEKRSDVFVYFKKK